MGIALAKILPRPEKADIDTPPPDPSGLIARLTSSAMRFRLFAWPLVLTCALAVQFAPWGERFDRWLYDQTLNLQRDPASSVPTPVVVGVDSETFRRHPEPFALWHQPIGDFFAAAASAGAALVISDLVLPNRSYEFLVPGQDRKLLQGLLAARGHTPVVLGVSLENGKVRELFRPLRLLAGGVGLSLIEADSDDLVRRLLPALSDGKQAMPSLPAEAVRLLGGQASPGRIDYRQGGPFDYLPLDQVLEWYRSGEQEPLQRELGGRTVLLGSTLDDSDLHRVPVPLARWLGDSTLIPGVLIHAQSLRTWLGGGPISALPERWARLLAVLSTLIIFGIPWRSLAISVGASLILLPIGLAWTAMAGWSYWPTPAPLLLGALTGLLVRGTVEGLNAARERSRLRNRFGRYVSPAVLGSILRGDLDHTEAPVRCRVCVLFADIRDFTTRSEGCRAEAIADLLNRYFEIVVTAIHDQGGTVDKFMGDGIMAFFGAPTELDRPSSAAIAAARGMREGVRRLNLELIRDGLEEIRIGIGLHAGEAVIGHIGSSQRQEYTAIGDTVNIASRVEGLCKSTACDIVCTQAVFDEARPEGAEALGEHPIKGHTPIQIYGLRQR